MSSPFATGDVVWVSALTGREESGIVLGVGCAYDDAVTGKPKEDGIMVKLHISNTKGIFSPSCVKIFKDSDSPIRSRSSSTNRRNRVTPSPSLVGNNRKDDDVESKSDKMDVDTLDADDESKSNELTGSPYFAKTASAVAAATKSDKDDDDDDDESMLVEFQVQKSPTSAAKCPSCNGIIRKGEIRLKSINNNNNKRGGGRWYHVICAKKEFGCGRQQNTIQSPENMEDYEDLDPSDQKRLRQLLHSGEEEEEVIPIGSKVRQRFMVGKKAKWFDGKVTSFDEDSGLYEITYDDGDTEECALDELQSILVSKHPPSSKDDDIPSADEKSDKDEEESDDDDEESVYEPNKNLENQKKLFEIDSEESDDDDDDKPLVTLKKRNIVKNGGKKNVLKGKAKVADTKTAAKSTKVGKEGSNADKPKNLTTAKAPKGSNKKSAPKGNAKKARPNAARTNKNNNAMIVVASDTDSDDLKDMPYRVEYAATGRATCKGCDERILKAELRIGERPLFRGKPGFVVYRHLNCAIFSEYIHRIQDVGGWRKLSPEDRDRLSDRVEESKLLIEKENQELQPDELVQTAFAGETRTAPPGLKGNLLPFQVEGLSWMSHQERHVPDIRGGLLCDEMGMGKTLQTITTILDNRPKLQHAKRNAKHLPNTPDLEERKREETLWDASHKSFHHEMEMANVPKKLYSSRKKGAPPGSRGGTLVVCPLIALTQWHQEIEKFTEEGSLSVCAYHGPKRASECPRDVLCKYDVVLTTYQIMEADFRKMVSPNKVKCPNCGGKYKVDKLRVHLKYFCGENAQRTEAQARQHRTADRHRRNNGGGGGGGGGNSKGGAAKKKSFGGTKSQTKTKSKSKKFVSTKKTVGVKRRAGYDSDSELSVDENVDMTSSRPTRAAARSAATKLANTVSEWKGANSDESETDTNSVASESEGFSESSEDESDSSASPPPIKRHPKKKVATPLSSSSDGSSDSSDDEEALARARKRQRLALKNAKASKKTIPKNVKGAGKGKGIAKAKGKQSPKSAPKNGKRKKPPLSDDSSSSSDDDLDQNDVDPMDGIDMDALIEEAMAGSQASTLHTICWWRVVLDEAHMIKSRSSQTAASAFALTSIHRWCLSGTPLQNRVGELYSLIRFLRIEPMAYYFCRGNGCDCKSIHYRMQNGRCLDCGCATSQHFSHFNKHVLNPIQRSGYSGDGRRAMMKLKDEVLDKSVLRRTKQTRAEDMNLPPRVVNIRTIKLHPVEEDFYNSLYTQTKSSFDDYVTQGTLLNNYAHIFDLLTKMRQAVDHPYLIVYSKKNAGKLGMTPNTPAVANGSIDCELCHEPPTDRVVSSCCGAGFCRGCVIDFMSASIEGMDQQGGTRCPSCRAPFTVDLNQETSDVVDDGTLEVSRGSQKNDKNDNPSYCMPSLKEMTHVSSGSILRRINLAEFATSTKVEALVEELVQMRRERPGSKALVFSQFVNMLDLVRWRLHSDPCLSDMGLGVRIIHGGMNIKSRDEALKAFREDPSVRVLLMSLKAGGVALNLTVANEAYLLDPWWNPAAEMQAIDRTHRLGQYRPIRAVRFIAEGTVEERVLQLQEKKRLVFDGTVGRDAASLKMLTVDDMKAMFA